MTLRRRLTLAAALAVGLAVALACLIAYLVVRAELLGQVDDQLRSQGNAISVVPRAEPPTEVQLAPRGRVVQPAPSEGGPLAYVQILDRRGRPAPQPDAMGGFRLRVDAPDEAIARRGSGRLLRTISQDGARLRVFTRAQPGGGAIRLARPLDPIESVLSRTRWILLAVCLGGVGLAALLGRVVTRRVTAPLREVAGAAGHIAETEDLGRRLQVRSRDEVGELAGDFNRMLDRLEASRRELGASVAAQRQLVADASHELRTPITSLRTNIEVLLEEDGLDAETRRRILADVRGQTEELGALVADVIELARGDQPLAVRDDVRLDELAEEAVQRARRDHPGVGFSLAAEPVVVEGEPDRLARALGNLLDNAAKYAGAGAAVDVRVDAEGVFVRDHGPGLDPADVPHLFDRFYRGATARGRPGTGLGLAIVRQVAERHGGEATAANAAGGGAEFGLRLEPRPVAAGVGGDGARVAARGQGVARRGRLCGDFSNAGGGTRTPDTRI